MLQGQNIDPILPAVRAPEQGARDDGRQAACPHPRFITTTQGVAPVAIERMRMSPFRTVRAVRHDPVNQRLQAA